MYIIYMLLCVINSIVLLTLDVGITSWQYWVSLFCVIGAYICGREY
jgi:hypothetical protein